ncbi:MAG: dipeptidase PepE [Acidobacteria bacterium]|nr:dipeptidase PepE [Acidobacteriota bacterium]MCI0717615.1 dipeptidase PepE [Acidobacteriota bacterium]
MKRLLLLSNSTNFGEPFLQYPSKAIQEFLGTAVQEVLFVPYAGVRISFSDYAARVRERFREIGIALTSVHEADSPAAAVERAAAIVAGGGNTFCLLDRLYNHGLVEQIRERVLQGVPYVGWSAGANVACPTIKTTNDMPIVEPPSLKAFGLVPFQINPHYTDAMLPNHGGETRAERLAEFLEVNPGVTVVGLQEGSMLKVEGNGIELLGKKPAKIFRKGQDVAAYFPGDSLQLLMTKQL